MMNKHEIRNRKLDLPVGSPLSRDAQDMKVSDRRHVVSAETLVGSSLSEECLVVDDRVTLRPAQAVENRLSQLLEDAVMPISHLQMRGMLRAR